jgi:hypothetical protein
VTPGLAHAGGPIAAAGLALVIVSRRACGSPDWAAGSSAARFSPPTRPAGLEGLRAAAALSGATRLLVTADAGGSNSCRYRLWKAELADFATETANLLVPLYAVIAGAAVLLGWELVRGDDRRQELGPLAWPLSLLVAWTGVSLLWTKDLHEGAVALLFFWLPFGLLAVSIARLAWNRRWLSVIYVQLVGMALAFAWIGVYQYATRDVFWNPKVIVANAYAPFYRVNSVFYDLRLRTLPRCRDARRARVAVYDRDRRAAYASAAAVVLIWPGLLFSFSQSSFAALMVGRRSSPSLRWRAAPRLGVAAAVIGGDALLDAASATRCPESGSGLNQASSGERTDAGIRMRCTTRRGAGVGGFVRTPIASG